MTTGNRKPRILFICHNHPTNRPGGAEAYAFDFFTALDAGSDFDPVFVAKAGPPMSDAKVRHAGTRFALVGDRPNEYFFFTEPGDLNLLIGTPHRKSMYTEDFREFLLAYEPDIVHFQHTLFLGYDLIREVKTTLPRAALVYTLHEYLPICNHNGQMVRTKSFSLCSEASPRRCHECFPRISPQLLFLRERFVRAQFDLVDLFIAPSEFLRQRYIDWGLEPERIRFEDYGRFPVEPVPDATLEPGTEEDEPRRVLGYFGQITEFKGLDVLLEAMKILAKQRTAVELRLHGANLELQRPEFQEKVNGLLAETDRVVEFVGPYEHEDLPRLMAEVDWVVVPSIWWENSPLVIQEAFMYRRPVICSDVGGMAEKVRDGVDGLHFAVRDPRSLAKVLKRAISTPGLWDSLRSEIRGGHSMDEHVATMTEIYRALLSRSGDRPSRVPVSETADEVPERALTAVTR